MVTVQAEFGAGTRDGWVFKGGRSTMKERVCVVFWIRSIAIVGPDKSRLGKTLSRRVPHSATYFIFCAKSRINQIKDTLGYNWGKLQVYGYMSYVRSWVNVMSISWYNLISMLYNRKASPVRVNLEPDKKGKGEGNVKPNNRPHLPSYPSSPL